MDRKLALAAALALLPALGPAQELQPNESEGLGRVQEGARDIVRGLVEEAQPAIEGIAGIGADLLPTFQLLAREMGPAFVEVMGEVDSISNYEPPAFTLDGDIVLRRREGAPAWVPPEAVTEPQPHL